MTDLAFRSATELAASIRDKEVSSRELLDEFLDRIKLHDPQINAVVTLDEDRARAAADDADAKLAAGEAIGPLHGLPVTIKDALETEGLRSTGGAHEMMDHIPATDAQVVEQLKEAGAIVFGKTNLPRWSGDAQSYNDMFGVTNNPWDLTRTPGGSSGGAAAAVAAGMTSFEIGTDIGGSIRLPSHFSGVWGHKGSYGSVPGTGYLDGPNGGTVEADNNLLGPLARSIDDIELLFDVISGPTGTRRKAWKLELPPPRHADIGSYRVAAWLDDESCPIDSEMRDVLEGAADALAAAGAQVDRNARPDLDLRHVAKLGMQLTGVATSVNMSDEEMATIAEKSRGAASIAQRHHTWLERDRVRTGVRAEWERFFTDHDVLLCPVTVVPAFPHQHDGNWRSRKVMVNGDERSYTDITTWTSFIGGAYLPVTTPPLGLTKSGLPVSVQVVAPYLEDRTAMHVARHLAELTGTGYVPPPDFV